MILCDSEQKEGYVRIKECNNIVDAVFEAGVVGAGGSRISYSYKA